MEFRDLLIDGAPEARWTLLLAHGAGQGMDSGFMNAIAAGMAHAGALRVARFEFPYMEAARRTGKRKAPDREPSLSAHWRAMIALALAEGVSREYLLIGGKSLGGRIASMLADDQGVAGLVCLGYPFHPPGKPERLRTAHLADLCTPCLICQGERDPFGSREEVSDYRLSSAVRLRWLPDGDHGFKPRRASGHTLERNLAVASAAVRDFVADLDTAQVP